MGIIDSTLNLFGLATRRTMEAATGRAYEVGFYDGNDEPPAGDLKSYGYKRQLAGSLRDFTKMSSDQIIDIVWTLYQSNPLAKRYLQIKRDHILGRGVQPRAADDDLRAIVDEFFSGNQLHQRLPQLVLQLYLFGEQCYPAFVRAADGAVTLGYIDPGEIEEVIKHPDNALETWAVVCKLRQDDRAKRVYRIIRKDKGWATPEMVITPNYPDRYVIADQVRLEPWEMQLLAKHGLSEYTGSCFYVAVNCVSNQPRGFSDLLQVADWLDSHDETLFALADREQFAGFFSWDVELAGATDDQVKARAKMIRDNPPKRGSVNVHNDTEKWAFNAPNLAQVGSIASADALETHALGGLGLPRHWYAHGDGTNRATAMAQGDPTLRTLQNDQDFIKEAILEMLFFVRDQAEIAGYWRRANDEAAEIDLTMPEMSTRDLSRSAATLGQLVNSLTVAVNDLRVITRTTAAYALAKALSEFGVEYDPDEELALAQGEQAQAQANGDTADAVNEWLVSRIGENGWNQ